MRAKILEQLCEIEEKENVRILHAVESGSRAWGFASPDSDYDVRFIYVRPKEFYFRLDKTRDVIEWRLDETLDINGWDLQKTLRLAHSSNPTIFEWDNSPIVYKTTPDWNSVSEEIRRYFSIKSGAYHYHSTALNSYRNFFKGETVKLKKYFYVLRPILACKWVLDKKTSPPMLFSELVNTEMPEELIPVVCNLLSLKMQTPELGEGTQILQLSKYIEQNLTDLKAEIDSLRSERKAGWEELNKLFTQFVK